MGEKIGRGRFVLGVAGILCGVLLIPHFERAEAACTTRVVNASGVASAAIAVTNAVAVTVLPAVTIPATSEGRCEGLIVNEAGGGDIRCSQAGVTPTTGAAGVGVLVQAGQALAIGTYSKEAWSCIATTGTAATVSTVEARG